MAGSSPLRPRVQRAVGFEFELSNWRIREANNGVPVDDAADFDADQSATSHRLPKGQAGTWANGAGVEFQADDAGSESDIEFVTSAFQETNPDRKRLEAAIDLIVGAKPVLENEAVTAMNRKKGVKGQPGYSRGRAPTGVDLAGKIPGVAITRPNSFLSEVQPFKVKTQATVGVRLGSLRNLMTDMFPTMGESATDSAQRDPGRAAMTGVTAADYQQAKQSPDTMGHGMKIWDILQNAVPKAEAAIDAFVAKNATAPAKTDALVSLLALIYAYLDMGRSGLVRSYSKTIAPVMARTDFATLFSELDAVTRDYYRVANGRRWIELVKTNSGYNWLNIGKAIYSGGIKESQEPNKWFVDLKRRDWLRSMTAGTDKLTAAHYPTARGRANVEGLGSYGSQMDVGGGGNAPIFELRGLKDMTVTELKAFALNLFDYVKALNSGQQYTFIANPPPTVPSLPPPLSIPRNGPGGVVTAQSLQQARQGLRAVAGT